MTTEPSTPDNHYIPADGLQAYAERLRTDHCSEPHGWCSCHSPLCGIRLLLDYIDQLRITRAADSVETARAALRRTALLATEAGKQRTAAWLRHCAELVAERVWPPAPAYKGAVVRAGHAVTVEIEGQDTMVGLLEHTPAGGWRVALPLERVP